jgi:molybdate transport system substrate-binding protein
MSNPSPPTLSLPLYDELCDLVGNPIETQLTLFLNGNQFMVMPELLDAFQRQYPRHAPVFYETLPPGLLAQQIEQGGRLRVGTLELQVWPDVYAAGRGEVERLKPYLAEPFAYASNTLALVVPAGNPAKIRGWADLARAGVTVAMPNPVTEGIARLARHALTLAGGQALAERVFEEKVSARETTFTTVHHREIVPQVAAGQVDAGVVWQSEAQYALAQGMRLEAVALPPEANPIGQYWMAGVTRGPHPEAAEAFLTFMRSQAAQAIYRRYGFGAPEANGIVYGGF